MTPPVTRELDPLLLPFLQATDDEESNCLLAGLLRDGASIISEILRSKLRVSLLATDVSHLNQEALDLRTETQATIVQSLRVLKVSTLTAAPNTIADFRSYVAAVTFNTCNQLLRRKYPKRFQLKNKLRYLLRHESQLALWEHDGEWTCGLAAWEGSSCSASAQQKVKELRTQPILRTGNANQDRTSLVALLLRTFKTLEGPVQFEELVSLMIDVLQIKEDVIIANPDLLENELNVSDDSRRLESQSQLSQLWKEICELPLRHRAALLLNLRERQGTDALELFVMTQVATIRDIGRVLEFEPEEFARIWNELPWDDAKIANHLGLRRQQVINLRQSARAQLTRKLKHFR